MQDILAQLLRNGRWGWKDLRQINIYIILSFYFLARQMNMRMPRIMVVQVLMYQLAVDMHVLMHQIGFHKELIIGENSIWSVIQLDPVVLTHHNGPFADQFHDLQVVCSSDDGLPGMR